MKPDKPWVDRGDFRLVLQITIYAVLSVSLVTLVGLMIRWFLWLAFAAW